MRKLKAGDRVKYGRSEEKGTVTRLHDVYGALVEWDVPVDSGDGVVSFDQWVATDLLTKI